jgi:small subunit ribosomal protein S5
MNTDEPKITEEVISEEPKTLAEEEAVVVDDMSVTPALATLPISDKRAGGDFRNKGPRDHKKNPRRAGKKDARVRSEFDHKTVSIRRVTRVTSGGRRFSFSVTLVAGNRKGMVGVGQGKSGDTPVAIDKALRDAKKNMIQVNTTKDMSIPHEVSAKFGSCRVLIMPAPGRGILAGSSARSVLELAGLTSVNAKILSGSKNRANIAKVTVKALESLHRTVNKK